MRSLFAKILLWFWATLTLTIIGSALLSALIEDEPERGSPMARFVAFQLVEARHAYETRGQAGLRSFFERFRTVFEGQAMFTDAAGRDLLTGAEHADLVAQAREHNLFPLRPGGRRMVRTVGDGRYWFFLVAPRRRVGAWFLRPQHWVIIAAGVLLCYALAFHLTSPVRQLQKAVERFGQGDFSARTGSTRRDELGELARTFDRMADRIEMLVAAERRLLLDISHELRSPLARLGVAIELARSGEDREAALNRIQKESERLNELVGELLEVTRAEGDPGSVRRQSVHLDQLLSELAGDISIEAQARGCSLRLEAPAALSLEADPELLRRALENVMRNAVRYAPAGSAVEVALERRDGRACVQVRDYGPGVPEQALPRIFDPFYRVDTDRSRGSGGVGLGLSIARRAIELHHGSIRARNARPGLLVEIELPAAPAPTSPA